MKEIKESKSQQETIEPEVKETSEKVDASVAVPARTRSSDSFGDELGEYLCYGFNMVLSLKYFLFQ